MKYISFLLSLLLFGTISYGGTVAGDETSDVDTKNLHVREQVTLDQPLVLDQDGFAVGDGYTELIGNKTFVIGNDSNISESENSIVIGEDAADSASIKDTVIIGHQAAYGAKLENSLVIGKGAGYHAHWEDPEAPIPTQEAATNQIFIDYFSTIEDAQAAGNATNNAIYIDNGSVNLGRGGEQAKETITNHLRGNWEIDNWHSDKYIPKWPEKYYFGESTTKFPRNSFYLAAIQEDASKWLELYCGNWLNLIGGNDKIVLGGTQSSSQHSDKTVGIDLHPAENETIEANGLLNVNEGISLDNQILESWRDLYSQSSWNLTTSGAKNYGNQEYYLTLLSLLPNGLFWWRGDTSEDNVLINSKTNVKVIAQSGHVSLESTTETGEEGGVKVDGLDLILKPNMKITVGERYPAYPSAPYSIAVGESVIEDQDFAHWPDSYLPGNGAALTISGKYGSTPAHATWNRQAKTITITDGGNGHKVGDPVIIKTDTDTKWKNNGVTGTVTRITSATVGARPRGTTVDIPKGAIAEIEIGLNTRAFGAVGDYSMAYGRGCLAVGDGAIANGAFSEAYGPSSHAEGDNCVSIGLYAHAEGRWNSAYANYSHAEGDNCIVGPVATNGHAEGRFSEVYSQYGHAEGDHCVVELTATNAHAAGKYTTAKDGDEYAYVWSGRASDGNNRYLSKGPGTFAIDPIGDIGGLKGFWIGKTNLYQHIKNIAGTGGSTTLGGLTDVTLNNTQNNEVLTYNSTTHKWENKPGGVTSLAALTDTTITSPGNNQVLRHDGTDWKNVDAGYTWDSGQFTINPTLGLGGFNIGNENLQQIIFGNLRTLLDFDNYSDAINVNTLIANLNNLYSVLDTYTSRGANLSSQNRQSKKTPVVGDGEPISQWKTIAKVNVTAGGSGYADATTYIEVSPSTAYEEEPLLKPIIQNGVITGVKVLKGGTRVNASEIQATVKQSSGGSGSGAVLSVVVKEYPGPILYHTGYKWGTRFINSGTAGADGNLTPIGEGDTTDEESAPPNSTNRCIKLNKALSSDSPNGADSDTSFDCLANCDKFTLMTWVLRNDDDWVPGKTDSTQGRTAGRLLSDLSSTTEGSGFQLRFASKSVKVGTVTNFGTELQLYINPNNSSDCLKSGQLTDSGGNVILTPYEPHTWYHIAVSYNKGTAIFYVDGKKQSTTSSGSRTVKENATYLAVGHASGANTFRGQVIGYMDDVMIFRDWTPAGEEDVQYWMNKDDAYADIPDAGEPVEFGEMNPKTTVYSAQQIRDLFGVGDPSIVAAPFGKIDPEIGMYSAEQVNTLFGDQVSGNIFQTAIPEVKSNYRFSNPNINESVTHIIDYNNGTVQGLEQNGNNDVYVILPPIENSYAEQSLTIYIDAKDMNKDRFVFQTNNISQSCLPLQQPWLDNLGNTIWRTRWISPMFDDKWYYIDCDKFLVDTK